MFFDMMQAVLDWKDLNYLSTVVNGETSTFTYEDALAFVGADLAVAA